MTGLFGGLVGGPIASLADLMLVGKHSESSDEDRNRS
jgi:hypothetical protein